jgi:hypothetical protein
VAGTSRVGLTGATADCLYERSITTLLLITADYWYQKKLYILIVHLSITPACCWLRQALRLLSLGQLCTADVCSRNCCWQRASLWQCDLDHWFGGPSHVVQCLAALAFCLRHSVPAYCRALQHSCFSAVLGELIRPPVTVDE